MSTSAQPASTNPRASLANIAHYALIVTLALGTAFSAAVAAANPLFWVVPVFLVTGFYLMTRVPLRHSAMALVALLLIPDDSIEAIPGQWRTPFTLLGDMLHFRLEAVLKIPGLGVTGMEILAVILIGTWVRRRIAGSEVDGRRQTRPAGVVRDILLMYVAAVLFSELFGLARGLGIVPWKLRYLLHVALLASLFLVAFRDARDHLLLGRLVVAAACVRSVMAIVVQRVAIAETGGRFAYATNHGDSLLLAVGLLLVLADFLERPDRRHLLRTMPLVSIMILGGIENQRRIFWVMVVMTLGAIYLLSPMKGWKLALTRLGLVMVPIVALYAAVGWNRASVVFAPVRTLRSVVDTSADRSAYWREVENWNIAVSLRESPILGLGLGAQYTEFMANDSISEGYREYREWPHNTFLGLLLLMGLFGFTAVFALCSLVVFLSVRSYRMATRPEERVAALGCLGTIIAAQVLAWGDTGAHYPQFKVLLGLAVAVSAYLAVDTGAWPGSSSRVTAQRAGGNS